MTGNYYDILGIPQTTTADEVKKAYRKLSLKFHPDKKEGDEYFSQMFKQINIAYNTLIDPEKRKLYDFQLREQSNVKSSAERLKKLEEELSYRESLLNQQFSYNQQNQVSKTKYSSKWYATEKTNADFPIKIKHVKYFLWVVIVALVWTIGSKGNQSEKDRANKQATYVKPKKKVKRKKQKSQSYQPQTIDTIQAKTDVEPLVETGTKMSPETPEPSTVDSVSYNY